MTARRTAANVAKTVVFLVAFWSVFLFAVPIAISVAEISLGIQRFPSQPLVALGLLLLGTLLTIWTAMTLAIAGRGTPLAIDPPQELVTTGPYGYVRHPFAIGVTTQIVGLGIALGSLPVIAYAAVALAVWYSVVRPREERGLEATFGEPAREYCEAVRGFRPRGKAYRVR